MEEEETRETEHLQEGLDESDELQDDTNNNVQPSHIHRGDAARRPHKSVYGKANHDKLIREHVWKTPDIFGTPTPLTFSPEERLERLQRFDQRWRKMIKIYSEYTLSLPWHLPESPGLAFGMICWFRRVSINQMMAMTHDCVYEETRIRLGGARVSKDDILGVKSNYANDELQCWSVYEGVRDS